MIMTKIQKIELQNKYMGLASPQRRSQQPQKKTKPPNEGKSKDVLFRKYGQVKRIGMHLQNTPIYYAKYKKQENEVKAQMELIK